MNGESFYKEFYNGGANALSKAENFRDRNPIVKQLADSRPLGETVGHELNEANLQKVMNLIDASEMIVLDTILNQNDRFGNIHYKTENVFVKQKPDGTIKLKLKKKPKGDQTAGQLTVKKMILKDNDCGVAKINIAKQANLSAKISHMNPETYSRLQKFSQMIELPEVISFFKNEMHFTEDDFRGFHQNLTELASELRQRCETRKLKLDLDLDAHFSNLPPAPVACDCQVDFKKRNVILRRNFPFRILEGMAFSAEK